MSFHFEDQNRLGRMLLIAAEQPRLEFFCNHLRVSPQIRVDLNFDSQGDSHYGRRVLYVNQGSVTFVLVR